MRVISLCIFLLFALSPAPITGQERVLTHESPASSAAASYAASIKTGRIESRGAMRVEGRYSDIFDTQIWRINQQHIWRVFIADPLKFIWNDDTPDPGKVELTIHEMSLSQDKNLSALVVNVNNRGEQVFAPAASMRRTVVDITSLVQRGENVIEISSMKGTNLLHGVQSVEVVYQRATRTTTKPAVAISGVSGARFYALIIAVQQYTDPKVNSLEFPSQDATRLKDILSKAYSFEARNISFLKDPDRSTIIEELDRLTQQITPDDSLLIFYAGHGYWDEKLKQGFWLPSNARRDSRAEWLSNSTLRDYLGGIRAKHVLLIADACFSGSIFKTRDAFSEEAASVQELYRLPSRKAMTSGAMKTVPDRSVFIDYLVKRLNENQESYLSAEELFSSMRKAVINNSPNRQTPQYGEIREAGDEGGDFVFVRRSRP